MNPFTEDALVETTAINLVKRTWGNESCHVNAFTDIEEKKLDRAHRGEVVLKKFLLPALEKLNPTIPTEALDQAIEQITQDRSHLSLAKANHEVYKILRDGANVNVVRQDGSGEVERVQFFDFEMPDNNHFLCVSQFWIVGHMYTRRPDVVLLVNGIPLILIELKASHKNLAEAYQKNLRDYKDAIPKIFWYNLGVIISNGIENKFGAFNAPFEYFNEWKKAETEEEIEKTDLATLIQGVCDKNRLLDIFENFVLFDDAKSEIKKIIPRYPQYFGVNRAFIRVSQRNEHGGKLGVFWHTQGSGKSYAMVFLSQKVFRKLGIHFTFVIVTDRADLDRKAYQDFENVGAIYEKEVHAESIVHLHELLAKDPRQIFTTIQKFQHIDGVISSRDDIIVMTDEAHRTQYDQYALNMRKALPNASFIGFTGTPLMAEGEERTREIFGDYVSVYHYGQSVADGATVPLFYENHVPKMENVNDHLERDIEKVMEFYNINEEDEERIEKEFSNFYQIVTREDRLNVMARDIVQHFVGRGYNGKAMVVSIDKKTAVRMYTKVKAEWERYIAKLRMDLLRAKDDRQRAKIEVQLERHENIDMAVIISQSQNEISDLEAFDIDMRPLRQRLQKENLEEEFKKPESNLRIAFVCAMWLTGFDVPNLSTLYLDKPLKNHTLMQAITRVNRVAADKKNGLIVAYLPVFKNIERALAMYAASGGAAIVRNKAELVTELELVLSKIKEFLMNERIDLAALLNAPSIDKLQLLENYANTIITEPAKKKIFLNLASDLQYAYQSILPDPIAEDYQLEVTAIRVIASRIRDVGLQSVDTSQVKRDIEDLLDKSIHAGEYFISQRKHLKDLSAIDANVLREFFDSLENKHLQVEGLSAELAQKISAMTKKNKQCARFMDRLNKLLDQYNSDAQNIDQSFNDLVELANDLTVEERRSVKENLSDEELPVFDLLLKENLSPDERDKVKKVARELLKKLKEEKLVSDWREWEATRSGVKTAIIDILYEALPEPSYSETECDLKGLEVYNFVYEHYQDAQHFV